MGTISRGIHKICQYFLALDLLVVTFILTVNVILRYIFSSSWVWTEELTRYLIAWATFVGAACCVTEGSDITIDSILSLLSKRGQHTLSIITTIVSIIFMVMFIFTSIQMTLRAWQNGQMATSMQLPIWIVYLSMPVGGSLTLFRFAEKLFNLIHPKPDKQQEGGQ